MKSILFALLTLSALTAADQKPHTHEKRDAGPNGGRIIATAAPRARRRSKAGRPRRFQLS